MVHDDVRGRLARHVLTDGFHLVLDLPRSGGSWITDARDGERYLDLYSFFASAPLGINPPDITGDQAFLGLLAQAAANKPTNPDIYTEEYADFADAFARVLGDPALPHLFFIEGGALRGERAEVRVRLEEQAQRDAGPVTGAGHPGAPPDPRVPRSRRVHPVPDQHRPGEDRALPQVRLAPHRGAGDHLPPR